MNPYLITEPTVISFSGGRTSAYMLRKILDENNGLPINAVVCFANTGKEDEATLQFVKDCEVNWNVKITWLEYDFQNKFKLVDFETASRNGEPFRQSIWQNGKPYLPNSIQRICTINLKIKPIEAYMKSIGYFEFLNLVGIRADESRRIAKIGIDRCPLAADGITKQTIKTFWENQNFDLGLKSHNGITYLGNCDLCFLKGGNQIQSLINENPEKAVWWVEMENLANGKFRKDRPSYQQMMDNAKNQNVLDFSDESIECFCGD
jgi:3'-phosphoadenosine 5'-phosphosulfate sulfotransferase (PAPS reductase)/FAD synthetase